MPRMGKIKNRKAPMTEQDGIIWIPPYTGIIRAAMEHAVAAGCKNLKFHSIR